LKVGPDTSVGANLMPLVTGSLGWFRPRRFRDPGAPGRHRCERPDQETAHGSRSAPDPGSCR
jgi:hypothetical protein